MPALADATIQQTFPVNFPAFNACNGENVTLTGTEHNTLHITTNANGGENFDFRANLSDVKGTGDQGNTYIITGDFQMHGTAQVGQEFTIVESFNVISQGSAPNFVMSESVHETINADGTVTSSHDNFTATCRG